jgi:hypothetical protein
MKVLKATTTQYNKLNNYRNGNSLLQFFKDSNNNWVINIEVINDTAFSEIKQKLEDLPLIDYEPKPAPPIG